MASELRQNVMDFKSIQIKREICILSEVVVSNTGTPLMRFMSDSHADVPYVISASDTRTFRDYMKKMKPKSQFNRKATAGNVAIVENSNLETI